MQDAIRQGMLEARATEEDLDAFMADHEALLTAADAFEPLRNAGGTLMEAFANEPDRLYGELLRLCRQVVQTMYENACAGDAGKYVNLFACASANTVGQTMRSTLFTAISGRHKGAWRGESANL
jgi:hypothetical protein